MCCSSDNVITSDDFRTDELTYAFKQSRFVVVLWNFCSSILENTLLCGPPRFRKKTIFFWPVCSYGLRWFRVEYLSNRRQTTQVYTYNSYWIWEQVTPNDMKLNYSHMEFIVFLLELVRDAGFRSDVEWANASWREVSHWKLAAFVYLCSLYVVKVSMF